jgi:peptide/nickel transport system substrate-binding protein
MTHALDRDALLREVERGRGVVPSGPARSTDPQSAKGLSPWPHDAAAARQLLAEAGWVDANGDGLLDRDGKPFEVTVLVGSTRRLHEEAARRLAVACAALGARVMVTSVSRAAFDAHLDGRMFDAALVETSRPDLWDPWSEFHSSQGGSAGRNVAGWRDVDADAVLDAMRAERGGDRRRTLAHRFHAIFHDQQPWTMILEPRIGVLISTRIDGVRVRPTGIHAFDMRVPPERVLRR